jgi:S-adenosylmethionine-diacylglycerol 3-amino-3-carboxypropyl transferase
LKQQPTLSDRIDQKVFDAVYRRSLVYNTCWEDPAVDRRALEIGPRDTLLVITSAGCNVLDYALCGPERIHAVDANPRQTALLELKLAGIRHLDFDDFFALFGDGRHARVDQLYHDVLRAELSPFAQAFWDDRLDWFARKDPADTFYFHGLAGYVARGFRGYMRLRPKLRDHVDQLFEARSVDEQRELYDSRIAPLMWGRGMNWTLSRQITMSMLGVPHPQRKEVQQQHAGGVAGFIRESIEYVVRQLPIWTNYFWTVYLRGAYTRTCCPEYLKRPNFLALKNGLADRITPYTCTVTEFLHRAEGRISKYVLLDHMDWMASYHPEALVEEWNAILHRAADRTRVIFRSAHARPAYLDRIRIGVGGDAQPLREAVSFHPALADALSRDDRVHTYAGFHIGDLRGDRAGAAAVRLQAA